MKRIVAQKAVRLSQKNVQLSNVQPQLETKTPNLRLVPKNCPILLLRPRPVGEKLRALSDGRLGAVAELALWALGIGTGAVNTTEVKPQHGHLDSLGFDLKRLAQLADEIMQEDGIRASLAPMLRVGAHGPHALRVRIRPAAEDGK